MPSRDLKDSTIQFIKDHLTDIRDEQKKTSDSMSIMKTDVALVKKDIKYITKSIDRHDEDIQNLWSITTKKTPKSIIPNGRYSKNNYGIMFSKPVLLVISGALVGASFAGYFIWSSIFQ